MTKGDPHLGAADVLTSTRFGHSWRPESCRHVQGLARSIFPSRWPSARHTLTNLAIRRGAVYSTAPGYPGIMRRPCETSVRTLWFSGAGRGPRFARNSLPGAASLVTVPRCAKDRCEENRTNLACKRKRALFPSEAAAAGDTDRRLPVSRSFFASIARSCTASEPKTREGRGTPES